jgi:hypothetical protein
MKKHLLQYALLLLPFFAVAQNGPTVYKDFTDKIKKTVTSFSLDDHTSIIETNIDDENFELIAVTDKTDVLWRTTLKGYAIAAGKFKGQILTVSVAQYSITKGLTSPYTGSLVDVKTGKVILQKVIYNSTYQEKEWAKTFFTNDNFNLVIGQTDHERSFNILAKYFLETSDLTTINLNEKLEAVNVRHIAQNEHLVTVTVNNKNDLFVFAVQDDNSLKVTKYDEGKKEPSGTIIQNIKLKDKSEMGFWNQEVRIYIDDNSRAIISVTDPNVAYFASVYKNQDKERQLAICKLNFNNNSAQIESEVFDSKHLKSIEKSFVPLDKKIDETNIGDISGLAIRHLEEYNGTIVVSLSDISIANTMIGGQIFGSAIVVNGYDINLKKKFQQLVPSHTTGVLALYPSLHADSNSLYVIANDDVSTPHIKALYCQLDLNTGNWLQMSLLEKEKLGKSDPADHNILWFKNRFAILYLEPHALIATNVKYTTSLISYSY